MSGERISIGNLSVVRRAPAQPVGKPPVVLVHGAWHGAWCWEGTFLDYFAAHGFETFALDLRGHGQSPAVLDAVERLRHYVDDVALVVGTMEQPPVVIGHSMGGFIAQHLLTRSLPLRGVGLLASMPHYGAVGAAWSIIRTRPLDFLRVNWQLSLYPLVADEGQAKAMFLDEDATPEEVAAFAARLSDESYLGFLDMLFLDLPRRPRAVLPPVVVVGAEHDSFFPPRSQERLAWRLNGGYELVKDAPHDLMLCRRWEVGAELLRRWAEQL